MKIAVLSPLPPVKSGIAHYSAMVLAELTKRHDVTAVVDQPVVNLDGCAWMSFAAFEREAASFDTVICQVGNNVHHEFAWNWARRHPSVLVLHEIVLHHLIVEATLARGNGEGLVSELHAEYGEAGTKVAGARVAGLHGEIENFLLPGSTGLAQKSSHVIVHNKWAATRLISEGVTTPITIVPHPFEPPPRFSADEIEHVRQRAGWDGSGTIIGAFGFVTHAKRPDVVMRAFAAALKSDSSLRLVYVGEPAPNVDLYGLACELAIPKECWRITGYVTDREFDLWMNVVDRVVSLRYPTAGESSGPIVRAFAVGRPVAVSDYAQFAELPEEMATRIPFDGEVEAVTEFMMDSSLDVVAIGEAQREWLASTSKVSDTVDGYDRAIRGVGTRFELRRVVERIPLFPKMEAALIGNQRQEGHVSLCVRLKNLGDASVDCASWGEPSYILNATVVTVDGSRFDLTKRLPRDLGPGETTEVELSFAGGEVKRIELRHALSVASGIDREPFAVLEPAP